MIVANTPTLDIYRKLWLLGACAYDSRW